MPIRITPDLRITAGSLSGLATRILSALIDDTSSQVAPILEAALKREVPIRTGNAQAGIEVHVEGGARGRSSRIVASGAGYLKYVIKGTKAHEIRPRTEGRMLAWLGEDGTITFAHSVQHPGQQANPFAERAWQVASPEIKNIIRSSGLRAWRERKAFASSFGSEL